MKKILVGLVSAVALATFATGMAAASKNSMVADQSSNDSAGVFISGDLGYGRLSFDDNTGLSDSKRSGLVWRVAGGYQFNPYIALEAGYTSYPDIKVSASDVQTGETITGKLATSNIDLLAKGILPVNDQFDLFAKAGMAYMTYEDSASLTVNGVTAASASKTHNRITPEFGIGAAYNITHNVALSIQGLTTLSPSKNYPATYTALAGVSYKFNV